MHGKESYKYTTSYATRALLWEVYTLILTYSWYSCNRAFSCDVMCTKLGAILVYSLKFYLRAKPSLNTEATGAELVGIAALEPPLVSTREAERYVQNLTFEQQAIRKCSVFQK